MDGELGRFLRSRRESVAPADVGLPIGPRRRTPGLRRAELATLAGISVDYLVRLEQGRDTHPSAQVLAALADALAASTRTIVGHLRKLAAVSGGTRAVPVQPSRSPRPVRPTVQALLDALGAERRRSWSTACPTCWRGHRRSSGSPVRSGCSIATRRISLATRSATSGRCRSYPDWDAVADEQVGNLRAGIAGADTAVGWNSSTELADAAGTAFTDRWTAQPMRLKRSGIKRLVHPDVGELRIAFETLQLPDLDEQRLVVWLAADAGDVGSARPAQRALPGSAPRRLPGGELSKRSACSRSTRSRSRSTSAAPCLTAQAGDRRRQSYGHESVTPT